MDNRINSIDYTDIRKYYNNALKSYGKECTEFLFSNEPLVHEDNVPFLSVVMRTQGKRPQALKEALLCLSSQTDTDFEVLIMGHDLDDDARLLVNEVIDECPEWLQQSVRLVEVIGGSRTTPLNKGFEEARGLYISIYDDDDLLFDNWVEIFRNLYTENPGTILHAYAVGQDWKTINTNNGKAIISASPFQNVYCKDFDFIKQLSQNFCPTMSLAFPAFAFKKLGIRFNESLSTTEDWDFLMRTSFVCGVSNSQNVTSIYRKWINEQNSTVLHSKDEWEKNYRFIQNQFMGHYYPVKISQLKDVMYCIEGTEVLPSNLEHAEVFIDTGSGFQANKTPKLSFSFSDKHWIAKVSDLDSYGSIKMIRFDPDDYGVISIDNLKLVVYDENNKAIPLKINRLRSNYVKHNNSKIFVSNDPQIVYSLSTPTTCKTLELQFSVNKQIPTKLLILSVFKFSFFHCFRKICRFCYHLLKKIKGRLS